MTFQEFRRVLVEKRNMVFNAGKVPSKIFISIESWEDIIPEIVRLYDTMYTNEHSPKRIIKYCGMEVYRVIEKDVLEVL